MPPVDYLQPPIALASRLLTSIENAVFYEFAKDTIVRVKGDQNVFGFIDKKVLLIAVLYRVVSQPIRYQADVLNAAYGIGTCVALVAFLDRFKLY